MAQDHRRLLTRDREALAEADLERLDLPHVVVGRDGEESGLRRLALSGVELC